MAARLGISEASLYHGKKAVVPSRDDERAEELLEVKGAAYCARESE